MKVYVITVLLVVNSKQWIIFFYYLAVQLMTGNKLAFGKKKSNVNYNINLFIQPL